MFGNLGYQCTNYIDDINLPSLLVRQLWRSRPSKNFSLFSVWSLHPKKIAPPPPAWSFWESISIPLIIFMTMSVTPQHLLDLLSRCRSLFTVDVIPRHDLQSLLGVMSFVTACVRPARIFMSGLLNTLRANPSARFCPLSSDDKSDLHWW